jgi:hypothetical protein
MMLPDILAFGAATAVVALVVHFFVRRYWLAVLISAPVSSLVNLVHEVIAHGFAVRPSDVALWLPGLFIVGVGVSLPIVAIIGIPFYVIRRRKQTKTA